MLASFEINRKILHILFTIIPVSLNYIGKDLSIILVITFGLLVIIIDAFLLKKHTKSKAIPNIFYREFELNGNKKFSGAFYIALSSMICVLFFNKYVYIPAMLCVCFCDTFASIIGLKFGKRKIFKTKKTIEGFIGFIVGFIPIHIIMLALNISINPVKLFIAIIIAGIAELITLIDDNLSIMIIFCLTYNCII